MLVREPWDHLISVEQTSQLVFGEAAALLGGYIGSVGTSFNKFPIDKLRWPDVSSKIKDEVYKDNIQTKFDVNDGIHKHHILGKIGKRLKPENQESNDGRKYTRGDMYGPSHKRSNGSFVNAEAQKKSVSDMDAPTRG
ncbi:hypothetical protein P8452_50431 [Trifolium repens]|nr:hypothetical protein P8452_50431 [Trifolium repens]